MRALVQRVTHAQVDIDGETVGSCERGYLILLGMGADDGPDQIERLWSKIFKLRIFEDENGKTNRSLADVDGQVLIVSQFTLYANCKRGTTLVHRRRRTRPGQTALRAVRRTRPPRRAACGNRPLRRHDAGQPGQRRPLHHLA